MTDAGWTNRRAQRAAGWTRLPLARPLEESDERRWRGPADPVAAQDVVEALGGPPRTGHAGGRRQQRKGETRERLLDAATELFVFRGFEETTYDDIARVACVARQTVFNYYPRKEDFVIAWGARRREEVAQALTSSAFAGEHAAARLVLIMRVLASSYEHSPSAGRVYTIAWVNGADRSWRNQSWPAQFAAVIAEGQRSGELRDDINAETAGQLIRAAYFDALWRWASPEPSRRCAVTVRRDARPARAGADRFVCRGRTRRTETVNAASAGDREHSRHASRRGR